MVSSKWVTASDFRPGVGGFGPNILSFPTCSKAQFLVSHSRNFDYRRNQAVFANHYIPFCAPKGISDSIADCLNFPETVFPNSQNSGRIANFISALLVKLPISRTPPHGIHRWNFAPSKHYYYSNPYRYSHPVSHKFVVGFPTPGISIGVEFLESTPFSILLPPIRNVRSFVSNFPIAPSLMTLRMLIIFCYARVDSLRPTSFFPCGFQNCSFVRFVNCAVYTWFVVSSPFEVWSWALIPFTFLCVKTLFTKHKGLR